MTYRLDDATQRNHVSPSTFRIPHEKHRRGLLKGDYAQLIFFLPEGISTEGCNGERMWVEVQSFEFSTQVVNYRGTLANHPVVMDLKFGDVIEFTSDQIIAIQFERVTHG